VDGTRPETCAECGFDSRRWARSDAPQVLGRLDWWWERATEGLDDQSLNRRPAPGVWSLLEYALHTALAVAAIREEIEAILAADGCVLNEEDFDIGDATEENWAWIDRSSTLADLRREGRAMAALSGRDSAAWGNLGWFEGRAVQAEAYLIHDMHDATHHFLDASRGLATLLGPLAGRVTATIQEGQAADGIRLGGDGSNVEGQVRTRPWQDVLLIPSEVPVLDTEGNLVLIEGVDWSEFRPGRLLRIGECLVEVSFPDDSGPGSGAARWGAWVRKGGRAATGDPVSSYA
jgi:hypothetical protein